MKWLDKLFDKLLKKWFNIKDQPKYLTGFGKTNNND